MAGSPKTSMSSERDHTTASLAHDLRRLGLRPGDIVLVHASLRSIGPVVGGANAVLAAIRTAVGAEGTVVAPTFTVENSYTSAVFVRATNGLGPRELHAYRSRMPPFDAETTVASPTLGILAETVRQAAGARRSLHPQTSFAAIGPHAPGITENHAPDCHLGERSPLGRLCRLGAKSLLIGTDFSVFSSFHLAEYRVPDPALRTYRCVVAGPGGRGVWWSYRDVDLDDRDFGELGAAYARVAPVRAGRVGAACTLLVPIASAVDFAVRWFVDHR